MPPGAAMTGTVQAVATTIRSPIPPMKAPATPGFLTPPEAGGGNVPAVRTVKSDAAAGKHKPPTSSADNNKLSFLIGFM